MIAALILTAALGTGPKVALPDWNGVNLKPAQLTFYAGAMAEALRAQGLQVVTTQDIATILGLERQKQLLGCGADSPSCLAELANALGCEASLVVNLARFEDGGYSGVAKLIGSRDGQTLSAAKLDARNERALVAAIEGSGEVLAAPLRPTRAPPSGPARWWWVPSLVAAAGAGASAGLLAAAHGTYSGLGSAASLSDARQQASTGQALQTGGLIAAGVGGAALVGLVVLLVWPATPVTPTVASSGEGASLGLRGRF